MYIFWFFILLLLFCVYLIFTQLLAVSFLFDTNNNDMHVSMHWMYPFLKITVRMENSTPQISAYVFKKRILSKAVQKKANKDISMLKAFKLQDVHITAYYGLNNPFSFGILCGVIEFIKALFPIEVLEQYPELMPLNEYVLIEARANLNIGKTLVNFVRLKTANRTIIRRNHYGSIKSA